MRQRQELELIFDAIPAFVFYKDAHNRVLRLNRAARACGADDGVPWSPTGPEQYRADLRVIASRTPELGVVEPVDAPGAARRWLEIARLPQFDETGAVRGIVVVAQDITDRKELEGRLLQAQKLESIGRLAGGVAHDFNNLLTSIFGLIKLAQRAVPQDSMAHEYMALLQLAAEGGANLTKQLLAFARRQLIEPRVVDLNGLVQDTGNLLERVLGETIEVHVELCSQALPVKVDPNQISQLLLNLALNARDAMPNGGRLSFKLTQQELAESCGELAAGRHAVLTIRDTGGGLSEEARQHLFEPFFTTKDFGKGTGLGLAMCYGIVKQNRGHIAVCSAPGSGTTFTIHLPQVETAAEPSEPERPVAPVEAGQETVLFVEDDDLLRHLAVPELAEHGYRLIEACNGEEALKAAAEHAGPIHLLVTDVVMPKMGGVELARRFKETRPLAPVLFISGYTHDAPMDGEQPLNVLLKPFGNDTLLLRVRQLLDAARARDRA